MYRCEAGSLAGFVQQLAARYVASGYVFYVVGRVPPGSVTPLIARLVLNPLREPTRTAAVAARVRSHAASSPLRAARSVIQSTAFWACDAAAKIARLSRRSTVSQVAR